MAAWRSTTERKTPRLRRRLGELGEEALDGVEPGGRGWREVEGEARMASEPMREPWDACGWRNCRG